MSIQLYFRDQLVLPARVLQVVPVRPAVAEVRRVRARVVEVRAVVDLVE